MARSDMESKWSTVTVTFTDGEVKQYIITAGKGIAGYLASEAGRHGVLSLFNDKKAFGIPTEQIREWVIEELDEKDVPYGC